MNGLWFMMSTPGTPIVPSISTSVQAPTHGCTQQRGAAHLADVRICPETHRKWRISASNIAMEPSQIMDLTDLTIKNNNWNHWNHHKIYFFHDLSIKMIDQTLGHSNSTIGSYATHGMMVTFTGEPGSRV